MSCNFCEFSVTSHDLGEADQAMHIHEESWCEGKEVKA